MVVLLAETLLIYIETLYLNTCFYLQSHSLLNVYNPTSGGDLKDVNFDGLSDFDD
jgi:hypothetical protein